MGLHRGLLAACVLSAPWSVRAEDVGAGIRLEYVRGAGAERCPDGSRVQGAVAAQLGRSPFTAEGAAVVNATVSRDGHVWLATLTLHDATGASVGSRALRVASADCRDVTDALAFALGLAVDSLARRAAPAVATPPTAPAPAAAPTPPAFNPIVPLLPPLAPSTPRPVAAVVRPPAPTRPWLFAVGLEGGAMAGVVPAVSVGLALAVEVRRARWGAELTAGYLLPGVAPGVVANTSASVDALRASLAPCVWLGALRLCLPCTVARVSGQGRGVTVPLEAAVPSLHLGLRADLVLGAFGGVSFRLAAGASAALVRASFRLDGEPIWSAGPIDGWGGAAVRYTFP